MIFGNALAAVLTAPATLPRKITEATITIRFAQGVTVTDEAAAFDELVAQLLPLYRAGFLSDDGAAVPDVTVTVTQPNPQSIAVALQSLSHAPAMLHGLLRLVWLSHETPAGAFEQLVEMLGSEKEAREIFHPRRFEQMITAVVVTAKGQGQVPFADLSVTRPPEHVKLIGQIADKIPDLDLDLMTQPHLPSDVENAFLTGHNSGLFGDPPPLTQAEPELWFQPRGKGAEFHCRGYAGDPSYLAELITLLVAGDLTKVGEARTA